MSTQGRIAMARGETRIYSASPSLRSEYLDDLVALVHFKRWREINARLLGDFFRNEIVIKLSQESNNGREIINLYNRTLDSIMTIREIEDLYPGPIELMPDGQINSSNEKEKSDEIERLRNVFLTRNARVTLSKLFGHLLRVSKRHQMEGHPNTNRFSFLLAITGDDDSNWEMMWPSSDEEKIPFEPSARGHVDALLCRHFERLGARKWDYFFKSIEDRVLFDELLAPLHKDKSVMELYKNAEKSIYMWSRKNIEPDIEGLRRLLIAIMNNLIEQHNFGFCQIKNYWRYAAHELLISESEWQAACPLEKLGRD